MQVGLVVVVCGLVGLAGCSGGAFSGVNPAEATGNSAGARLTGTVHGGQQAIVGAHVYLFAANTTGYGGAGIAASSGNASLSLLTSGSGTTLDTSGGATNGDYYVTTDSGGNFTITGDYTCTAGQQVYLYSLGGNPGSGVNSAAGLLAVLGNCPAVGNFAAQTPFVMVNEVSTISAAYAMAGFATDATHVSSSGTPLAQVGIANAFANAANLVDLPTGTALATTPAGNGTVPQTEINTLANILAACVNSTGPVSTACSSLFSNLVSGGTQPTDSATAAINLAHNPGNNTATLYGLQTATSPFATKLASQPPDFTIGISFSGGGLDRPQSIAVDGSGNAWVVNEFGGSNNSGTVSKFSAAGVALSPSAGFTGGGLNTPIAMAIDGSGNAWIVDESGAGIAEFSNAGAVLSPSTGFLGGGLNEPFAIAIDNSGNAWVTNYAGNSVSKFSNAGAALSPSTGYTGGGMMAPRSVAIDGSGNAWTANTNGNNLSELSNTGAAVSPSTGYPGGGLNEPWSIAMDGSGNAWIANWSNAVSEFSRTGAALSPSFGYIGGGLDQPQSIAIDGSGNAWIASANESDVSEFSSAGLVLSIFGYHGGVLDFSDGIAIDGSGNVWISNRSGGPGYNGIVTEMIGIATPVITPVCAGLPVTPTADGSSRLGTRP
jgi:hypothetical protein